MQGKIHYVIVRRRNPTWIPDAEGRGGVTTSDTTVLGRLNVETTTEITLGRFAENVDALFRCPLDTQVSDADQIVVQPTVPDPNTGLPRRWCSQPERFTNLLGTYEIGSITPNIDHLTLKLRRND